VNVFIPRPHHSAQPLRAPQLSAQVFPLKQTKPIHGMEDTWKKQGLKEECVTKKGRWFGEYFKDKNSFISSYVETRRLYSTDKNKYRAKLSGSKFNLKLHLRLCFGRNVKISSTRPRLSDTKIPSVFFVGKFNFTTFRILHETD